MFPQIARVAVAEGRVSRNGAPGMGDFSCEAVAATKEAARVRPDRLTFHPIGDCERNKHMMHHQVSHEKSARKRWRVPDYVTLAGGIASVARLLLEVMRPR